MSLIKKVIRKSVKAYTYSVAVGWAAASGINEGLGRPTQFCDDQVEAMEYFYSHIDELGCRAAFEQTIGFVIGRTAARCGHYDVVSTVQRLAEEAKKQETYIH